MEAKELEVKVSAVANCKTRYIVSYVSHRMFSSNTIDADAVCGTYSACFISYPIAFLFPPTSEDQHWRSRGLTHVTLLPTLCVK